METTDLILSILFNFIAIVGFSIAIKVIIICLKMEKTILIKKTIN
jgi:hypothetical protein